MSDPTARQEDNAVVRNAVASTSIYGQVKSDSWAESGRSLLDIKFRDVKAGKDYSSLQFSSRASFNDTDPHGVDQLLIMKAFGKFEF